METSLVDQFEKLSDEELEKIARVIDRALRRNRLRQGRPVDEPERPEHRACRRQS